MTFRENLAGAAVRPRSVLEKLPRYAAGKPPGAAEGLQSYKLSSNENPLPPIPAVLAAIAETTAINRYPDPTASALRAELADFLAVPTEDIVTGTGSLGALNQILAAFAGQNEDGVPDEVIYPWRSFEAYPISVGLSGATSIRIPLRPDGTHDLSAMAAAVTERTKIVLLCTPNNPTGPSLSTEQVEWFIRQVPGDVIVVIDEAYQEFVRDPQVVDGIVMYRKHLNVISLRTFSKAHGLANLRVGYSVSSPELTQYLHICAVPFGVSSLGEQAAITSLRHNAEVVERVQSIVDQREYVTAGLQALGWFVPEAQGNFVWLGLGEHTPAFTALAAERALSVRGFGTEGIRVSIGEPEANRRFLELCANYPTRPPFPGA